MLYFILYLISFFAVFFSIRFYNKISISDSVNPSVAFLYSVIPGMNILVLIAIWVLLGIAGIVNFFESKTYQNFYNWFINKK